MAQEMVSRGVAVRRVARQLGVSGAGVRYRLQRSPEAPDGRRERPSVLDGWEGVVAAVLERLGDGRVTPGSETRAPTRTVFDVLVREFGFRGELSGGAAASAPSLRPRAGAGGAAGRAPLQAALDARSHELHERRRCPATGTTVSAALRAERHRLQPLPRMHEPFDVVVARRVSHDALVSFEGRRASSKSPLANPWR